MADQPTNRMRRQRRPLPPISAQRPGGLDLLRAFVEARRLGLSCGQIARTAGYCTDYVHKLLDGKMAGTPATAECIREAVDKIAARAPGSRASGNLAFVRNALSRRNVLPSYAGSRPRRRRGMTPAQEAALAKAREAARAQL